MPPKQAEISPIKRPIVKKDFRSNVSLGSVPETHTLTKLEQELIIIDINIHLDRIVTSDNFFKIKSF